MQLGGERANGLALNYGAGCTGTNGVPVCTTVSVPCLPNPDFRVRVHRAAGNSLAIMVIGFSSVTTPLAGAPGCSLLNGLEFGTFGFAITDPTGDASLAFPLLNMPAVDGLSFFTQWAVLDPSANSLGIVVSDGQQVTLKFF
jgi:hypothetical protein